MENKENNNVSKLAADTIIKWYEQTHTTIIEKGPTRPNLDSELLGMLLAAKSQTSGALTTLANNHILSTHGLLRILVETYAVLRWALNVSASDEKTKSDEVYKRLRRWDYTRLNEDKKLLENLPRTPKIESALGKVNKDIGKLQEGHIKGLPNNRQLYENLGKEWVEVYARFYMKYSRAIHLNRNVTQKLVWIQNENEKPKAIFYKNDIEPDGNELLIVASISCDINKVLRSFYGWQSDAMQNEYEQLESRLVKK